MNQESANLERSSRETSGARVLLGPARVGPRTTPLALLLAERVRAHGKTARPARPRPRARSAA